MNSGRMTDHKKTKSIRTEGGFSTVALILVIVFFAVLPAALFSFEAARASLVQIELQNVTDSAALGGTAYLAGSADLTGSQTISDNQLATMNAAYQFFTFNQIMDTALIFTPGANNVLWGGGAATPGTVNCQAWPATFGGTPPLHCAQLLYTLLDNTNTPQPLGNGTAVSLKVTSTWTEKTIFAGYFLPILATYQMSAVAFGGLPQLDMVLCFDVSGSMDDGTNVCMVNRYYDPNNGAPRMVYAVVPNTGTTTISSSTGCNPLNGDCLFSLMGCANLAVITGTPVNAGQPQQLSLAGGAYSGVPGVGFNFMSGLRAINGGNGLTAPGTNGSITAEASSPPGNYNGLTPATKLIGYYPLAPHASPLLTPIGTSVPNATSATSVPSNLDFTDMVVLLPSISIATGTLTGTYNFPGSSTAQQVVNCVEASRGNLESTTALSSATCGLNSFTVLNSSGSAVKPTSQAGSYGAYWYGVRQYAYPMSTAVNAAANFFQTMNLSTNAHFSLVTFAGTIDSADDVAGYWSGDGSAGSPTGSTINNIDWNYPVVGSNYTYGGQKSLPATTNTLPGFPLPCMALQTGNNNFTEGLLLLTGNQSGVIDPYASCLVATGGTNMSAAITQAFTILGSASARSTAKKAIVLFSDGIPTDGADPVQTTTTLHGVAANQNIPVYTIGLSITQNSTFNTTQGDVLGDGVTPNAIGQTSGNGIASVTLTQGSHAYFVPANNPPLQTEQSLNSAFEQIAKSLVVLQQN